MQATAFLCRKMSPVTEHHMRVLHLDYALVTQAQLSGTDDWCQINFTGEPALIEQVEAFLAPYLDEFYIASSLSTFCEITAAGVNKGTALQRIASECKIAPDRILRSATAETMPHDPCGAHWIRAFQCGGLHFAGCRCRRWQQ